MQEFINQPITDAESEQRYQAYLYKKSLKRTTNGLGALLLVFFGAELVLSITLMLSTGGAYSLLNDDVYDLLFNGVISTVIFFVVGVIYCFIRKLSFAKLFPFEKIGSDMLAKLCVIGITFSLMSNYVVDMINNTFGLFGIENHGGNIDFSSPPNVLLYFLTVAIMPAFVEEFAFRGVILGALRPYSDSVAVIVSSAAFALMHGNFVQMPFTFCCGLVFGFLVVRTNSLMPAVIVHFLNNALSVLADVLSSHNLISDNMANVMYGVIFVVTGILSLIFIRSIAKEKGKDYFKLSNGNPIMTFKNKIKTVCSSPTLISFAAIMVLYSVFVLTSVD